VRYYDSETDRELIFLTNNLEIPALTVAMLYKMRWRIEPWQVIELTPAQAAEFHVA
jgi:hypothetical protein